MPITSHLKRPTRWLDRADPHRLRGTPAYLVLLRGGFTLPVLLPVRRWALTPPFHPCLIPVAGAIGGLFSAALSVGSPRPGITWPTALRSPDFPLRVNAATPWSTLNRVHEKPPDRAGGLWIFNVAATYFSTYVQGSIIGPLELNCRVRDGNGCDLQGIATTKGAKNEG